MIKSATRTAPSRTCGTGRRGHEAVRPYADRIDEQKLLGLWLDLAFGTGWRKTAICEFRPCDYDPKRDSVRWPYGRLHKRWETDKEMDGRWVPIDSEHTRASVEMLIRKGGAVGRATRSGLRARTRRGTGTTWQSC